MSTIQELKDELETLMVLPYNQGKQLRTLALIGKILTHMEAYERAEFSHETRITSIENKLQKGGKVEVNVRYSEET